MPIVRSATSVVRVAFEEVILNELQVRVVGELLMVDIPSWRSVRREP